MDNFDFSNYLLQFEEKVISRGVEEGILGKTEMIPVRNGKLLKRPFGRTLGKIICSDEVLAVDYYGHIKKSTGFFAAYEECSRELGQVKMLSAVLIHFAKIRIEEVYSLSRSAELTGGFPAFKEELLRMKGFKKK